MTEAPGATPTGGAAHSGGYGLYTMVQLLPSHLCSMGGCGDLQNGMNVVSGPALVYRNGTVNLVRVMSTVARYSVRSVTIVGATVAGGSISAVCRADVREPSVDFAGDRFEHAARSANATTVFPRHEVIRAPDPPAPSRKRSACHSLQPRSLRPRRHDSARACIGDRLAHVIVHVGDQLEEYRPLRHAPAVERRRPGELCLGHLPHAGPHVLGGAAQERDDLCLLADPLQRVAIDPCRRVDAHRPRRI